jgi:lysophospholipase L1-like esterase
MDSPLPLDKTRVHRPWGPAALSVVGVVGFAAAAVGLEQAVRCWRAWKAAEAPSFDKPFQRHAHDSERRVLIVGDSTGVGVGAEHPSHSVGGLLASEVDDAHLVNLSVSGACIADVPRQLQALKDDPRAFDLVLLHIGGNDIMRVPNLAKLEPQAEQMLDELQRVGRHVVWLGPGDLGLAPLFRPAFAWYMTRRTRQAGAMFKRIAAAHGADYVGFHDTPHRERFLEGRARFFSQDGIHPSSEAYRYCYAWLVQSAALDRALLRRAGIKVPA